MANLHRNATVACSVAQFGARRCNSAQRPDRSKSAPATFGRGTSCAIGRASHLTTFTKLYEFRVKAGAQQIGNPTFGPDGSVLGALSEGGKTGGGAIYRFTP